MKICTKCKIEKPINEFYKDKNAYDGLQKKCKNCVKNYYNNNKNRILKYHKEYYNANIENETFLNKRKKYRKNNKDYMKEYNKNYRKNNKTKVIESKREWKNNKRKTDPKFKLDDWMSTSINKDLKKRGSSKKGRSWTVLVDYTKEDLRQHLESLWEPWMNWENHGPASTERRTWNIDHIFPKSKLIYENPEDDNFKKCWSLSNLRPLEAIENIQKSNKIETK
jgi:hypothetical protein